MLLDLNRRSPLCAVSMALSEVRANEPFMPFDLHRLELTLVVPLTGPYEATEEVVPRTDLETHLAVEGIVVPRHGRSLRRRETVALAPLGISPYEDGSWSRTVVSFPGTPERLTEADTWLKQTYGVGLTEILSDNVALWSTAFEVNGNIPPRFRCQLAELLRPYRNWAFAS